MKVYEIVANKQALNEFSLNPLTWFGGSQAKTAAQTAADAQAAKAAADAAKSTGASAELIKLYDNIAKDGNVAARKAATAAWDAKIGRWSIFLKVLTLYAVCAELVYHLYVTDKMYENNQIKTEKEFKDARAAFWGIWEVQAFAPWLVTALANTKIVRILAQIIFGVATLGVGFFAGGVGAITGIVLETAVFEALEAFLHSDTFKKWLLSPNMLQSLIFFGSIPDEAWNQLRKLLSQIPIINKFMDNPGMGVYDSEKENKRKINPAAVAADELGQIGKINNVNTAPNAVLINNINITNPDGTLDDWAFMKPEVQTYIKAFPNDPAVKKIASIPRAANSIYKK